MKSPASGKSINPKVLYGLLAIVVIIFWLFRNFHTESLDLQMGNPSGATRSAFHADNYLMEKEYFTLSYNNSKGTPNWVCWRLEAGDLGDAPRTTFYPDETLPGSFQRITPKDYTGSGFDRGHMCPHSDRSANPDMSHATFVMSNIIPQSPPVNQKAWAQLEMYCRSLVERRKKKLYIISGPAGQGGTGSDGFKNIIGERFKVVVPAQCWKVIMVLDAEGGDDLQKVNEHTRLIAIIMPNDMSVGEDWSRFRVPVKDVEKLTGYKFFSKVPANIIEPLKEKADDEHIPAPEPSVMDLRSERKQVMPNEIDTDLQQAIQGLLYTSETDAPFEIIHWPDGTTGLDAKRVLQLSGHKPKDPVRITSMDDFFKPLTDFQAWFGKEEKETAQKFRKLRDVIEKNLNDTKVFRAGKIQIDIFIVGKSAQGDWTGVKTRAVET